MPFQERSTGLALVTTGNVRTSWDPVVALTGGGLGDPRSYQLQVSGIGLRCPLGTTFMDQGGPDSVSGTTTQLPQLQVAIYKYVLYKSATNPALVAFPGLVYYTDETYTVVSGAPADAQNAAPQSNLAGLMMLNSTDLSTITATLLNNGGNGSGVWVCVGGFVKAAASVASTAVGDSLVGSASGTNFTPTRVAAGTAATYVRNMTALTAISGSTSDVVVNIIPAC